MPMTRKEMHALRRVIIALHDGPLWSQVDLPESMATPVARAIHAELTAQTRQWVAQQVRELQAMLPLWERVSFPQVLPPSTPRAD